MAVRKIHKINRKLPGYGSLIEISVEKISKAAGHTHTHTHYVHYWVWIAVWSAISCMLCETRFIGLLHFCSGWANHLYFRWILRCLVAGIFSSVGIVGLNKWPGKFRALNQCNFRITPHYSQPACLFAMHFCYISVLPHALPYLYMCTFMCIRPLQFC